MASYLGSGNKLATLDRFKPAKKDLETVLNLDVGRICFGQGCDTSFLSLFIPLWESVLHIYDQYFLLYVSSAGNIP